MAEIRKVGIPSVSSVLTLSANRISGSLAGEDIAAADACYLDQAGRVWRSRGAAPGPTADVRGFAAAAARQGESITLVFDVTMRCGGPDAPKRRSTFRPRSRAVSPTPRRRAAPARWPLSSMPAGSTFCKVSGPSPQRPLARWLLPHRLIIMEWPATRPLGGEWSQTCLTFFVSLVCAAPPPRFGGPSRPITRPRGRPGRPRRGRVARHL